MYKLGSLFDGSGTCPLAASLCGMNPVWASEIEPYPIAVTASRFPNMKHLGSVTGVRGDKVQPVDIITFGSPCFPAGTLVNTADGLKPIEHVSVGDRVLSHTGMYRYVLDARYTGTKPVLKLKAMGIDEIEATENHRFLVRTKTRIWDNVRQTNRRAFSKPQWTELKDVRPGDYLSIPLIQTQENPLELTHEECWLIGRYIADGYIRNGQRPDRPEGSTFNIVMFCIGKGKLNDFENHLTAHKAGKSCERNVAKYAIRDSRLLHLCEMCGTGAENKIIPVALLNLPIELLTSVVEGYMSGAGCCVQGRCKATTVSRALAYSLGAAVAKAYRVPYCVYRADVPATTVIEGRTVNQKPLYQVTFKRDSSKQDKAFYENGCIWVPVNGVSETGEKKAVYDLTVAEDHSFCVLNVAAHNCQDLSIAGKRAGIRDGERSNLFFEAIRIIKEMRSYTNGKYPRFAVWENVPGAFSSNNGRDFHAVLQSFCEIAGKRTAVPEPPKGKWSCAGCIVGDGYSVAWRTLDAQYWGVPQRRRRIYLVADFGGECAGKILFERESVSGDFETSGAPRKEATGDPPGGAGRSDYSGVISAFMSRQGAKAHGLMRNRTPTLKASPSGSNQVPSVIYPNIARTLTADDASPCVDRGQNIVVEPCVFHTLTASNARNVERSQQPNCVCYDARGNGGGVVVPTVTGDHNNRVTDYTSLVCMAHGQANAEVMENLSPSLNCNHEQPILAHRTNSSRKYIVRRLTPMECARLQGFPDGWGSPAPKTKLSEEEIAFWESVRKSHAQANGKAYKPFEKTASLLRWYNKLHTDVSEYKMWGNGMALPCMLYVMRNIGLEFTLSTLAKIA